MRDRERPEVEIAESPLERADVHPAVIVGPTARVFVPIGAQFVVSLRQLTSAAPFRAGHYEILPERSAGPVIRCLWLVLGGCTPDLRLKVN